MPAPADLTEFEAFAIELANAAGGAILPLFRTDCGHENKAEPGAYDPVTEADKSAERAIRALIAERYPEHGVLGEEYGADRDDAEHVWVLDPVDGTRAFVAGLPLWTTLIALRRQGRPVLGVIAQPYLDEIFIGSASGSRLIRPGGSTPLQTRPCSDLSQAVIATTDPDLFKSAERPAWNAVRAAVRLARYGCDAYAYAMVAMGRIDLVIESGLKPWDYEALAPVIEGAGGRVRNWRGEALDGSGQVVAAGDARLLDQAAQRLSAAAV
jgi:histidinol phosphatase-like enzyme (inositol monophosphatase family)